MTATQELSHVGMKQCFICGEANEILLDRRLRKTLPRMACYDKRPCGECEKHMQAGVILISCRDPKSKEEEENPYRTGGWVVIKEEAARRIYESPVLKSRVAFVNDEAWQKIGLPYGDKNPGDDGYGR